MLTKTPIDYPTESSRLRTMTKNGFMRHGTNVEETILRSIDPSRLWIHFLTQRYQAARDWTDEEPWMQDFCGHFTG